MNKHVGTCKNTLVAIDQEAEEIKANMPIDESQYETIFDTADHFFFDNVDSAAVDDVSFSVDAS